MKIAIKTKLVMVMIAFLGLVCFEQASVSRVFGQQEQKMFIINNTGGEHVEDVEVVSAIAGSPFSFIHDIIQEISQFLGSREYRYRNPFALHRLS